MSPVTEPAGRVAGAAGPWRVLVRHRAPAGRRAAVEAAYREASAQLRGTPGYQGDELLYTSAGNDTFLLVMRWDGEESFRAWEAEHRLRGHPSPLREFQDRNHPGGHYETFVVRAERTEGIGV